MAHSPNSDVSTCGLHQKPLIEQSFPTADQEPQGLGKGVLRYCLTVLVCPVTEEIVSAAVITLLAFAFVFCQQH
jgi:hypothetical protein